MGKAKIEIDYDAIYDSNNCGKFKIIKELDPKIYKNCSCVKRMVRIKFVQTGYEKDLPLLEALKGKASDPYYPILFGVGYWGEGVSKGKVNKREYDLWYTMLYRCYCRASSAYRYYGAEGVTVCERWHCLSNFIQDIQSLPNYFEWYNDKNSLWTLDKDYLQFNVPKNQRIYSPETCMFIIASENSRIAGLTRKRESTDDFSNKYYGLYKTPCGTYQVTINIDKHKYFLGTYNDELAAATVYNFVATRCTKATKLNNIPYMDINEALKHNTSKKLIEFPPNIKHENLIQPIKYSSEYIGVGTRNNRNGFCATYFGENGKTNIGLFTDEIAAANAHNWYETFYGRNKSINKNIPYMAPSEWLKYKSRYGKPNLVQMCTIVDHEDN